MIVLIIPIANKHFSKAAGIKVNSQKSVGLGLLHSKENWTEKEIREIKPFKIAADNINMLE